ncbi:MAG: hypothetical protein A6F72_07855 [Cycloclasticus sp. symbiont of Poecilosclerida sp. N]|nr:MAG: hypothetical protein A6F72_07855 [Cycloclasticus sp. symbiont of Poecilosclerida sp. N]
MKQALSAQALSAQALSAQALSAQAPPARAKTISIIELLKEFSTEHKSIKQLEKIRWDKEPICPHCGGIDNIGKYKSKKHTYWHKDCRKAFTVKTNTIMHASKIPTQKWVVAIYTMLTSRKSVSSL